MHSSLERGAWRRTAVAALLLVALVAAGCGGPRNVSLSELAFEMEAHDGNEVVTQGVVVEFDEEDGALDRHLVVQDSEMNRVELVPLERAEPYVGSTVEVAGEFEFDPDRGRFIRIDRIEPVGQDE